MLQEQSAALQEGAIPRIQEQPSLEQLSPEQNTINEALLPEDLQDSFMKPIEATQETEIVHPEQAVFSKESALESPTISENVEASATNNVTRDKPSPPEVINDNTYSGEINESIRSKEEHEFYKSRGLEEGEVNGKKVLKNPDIDPNMTDERGRTNKERMKEGKPPIGEDGKPMELHHIGQKPDSPLAELTSSDHRRNKSILHDSQKSEVNHGSEWQKSSSEHWKERAKDFMGDK